MTVRVLLERVLDASLFGHVVAGVLDHLTELVDDVGVTDSRIHVQGREALDKVEPLLVVDVGTERLPQFEDGGQVVLRVRDGEEMRAERLRGDDRVEVWREARQESREHGGDLVRWEETLRVLDEREERRGDVGHARFALLREQLLLEERVQRPPRELQIRNVDALLGFEERDRLIDGDVDEASVHAGQDCAAGTPDELLGPESWGAHTNVPDSSK